MSDLERVYQGLLAFFEAHRPVGYACFLIFSVSVYNRDVYGVLFLGALALLLGLKKAPWKALVGFIALMGLWGLFWGLQRPPHFSQGKALFKITKITPKSGFFGDFYAYEGQVIKWTSKEGFYRIPILFYQKKDQQVLDKKQYLAEGSLEKSEGYGYVFKRDKNKPLLVQSENQSIAYKRFCLKNKVRALLKEKVQDEKALSLLSGLCLGEFSDPLLSYTFSRLGLSHLLALSGFHFSLLILMLNLFLEPFFNVQSRACLLFLLTSFFCLFIGFLPSFYRAWISLCVLLFALLFKRPTKALNHLAWAFILMVLFNPFIISHLGFQLSFLTTLSILLFYPIFQKRLETYFKPQKPLSKKLVALGALNLSVLVSSIALSLYHFHKFYYLSPFYNFVVPLIVSGILFLLFFSLLFAYTIPFIGTLMFKLLSLLTQGLLNSLYAIPSTYDYCMRIQTFSKGVLWGYFALLFLWGFYETKKERFDLLIPYYV